ncbi:MAG: hypothetical protein JNK58_10955 [Phycisphaerae bacterium]|nr:hypothetical protein [Phycisphaerae bacterium]
MKAFHRLMGCVVAGLCLLFSPSPAGAMQPKLEFNELVHGADLVIAGRVESMVSRRTDNGGAIVTDVSIRVLDLIHRAPLAAAAGEVVVLTHAGGDFDGVGMSVSGTPKFEVGGEYLLFAFHDGQLYLNPLVGGTQGMFKIVHDETTGRPYPLAPGGLGIRAVTDGKLSLSRPVARIADGRAIMSNTPAPQQAPQASRPGDAAAAPAADSAAILSLDEVKDAIIQEAAKPLDHPSPMRRGGAVAPQEFELNGKLPVSGFEKVKTAVAQVPTAAKEERPDLAELKELGVAPGGLNEPGEAPESIDLPTPEDSGRASLCYCGYHNLFLTMEQVPVAWASYAPNNDCMFLYNQFMDIYRFTADDGTFGNNSQNEFCGFISQAQLNSIYGFNWGSSLAITVSFFPSGCPCCALSQSDIMFNPAYSWVYSFASGLGNNAVINYLPVVIHELGHSWGNQRGSCTEDYSYVRPTVMHAYYWNVVEDGWGIHSWDSFAIRDLYSDQTSVRARNDVGIESYVANGNLVNATTNATTYRPGDSITVSNVTAENMSNTAQSDVRVRMWLSTNNIISTGDYQMGGDWTFASFSANGYSEFNMTTTVPNVPPGTYYVGLMITRLGASYAFDDFSNNNTSFLYTTINIIPPLPSNDESENAFLVGLGSYGIDNTGATTDGFAHAACNVQNNNAFNDVWYRYTPSCDGTLSVSTCGQANFDTVLVVYRYLGSNPPTNAQQIACNDDFSGCSGFTSYLTVPVVTGQPYLIRVGGWSSTTRGTGTLTLGLTPNVPNNSCAGAIAVGEGAYNFNTTCATTDGLSHAGCQFDGQTYNDVWYRFTASCTGDMTVSTCNIADYDTDLAVYSYNGTCPPGNGLLLGCNDDAPGCAGYSSIVTVPVVNGQTYLIRIGGYQASNAGTGAFTLSVACAPPPDCAGDANQDGMVSFADITSVLEHWNFTYPGGTGPGDSNHDGVVNFADITSVLEHWGLPC